MAIRDAGLVRRIASEKGWKTCKKTGRSVLPVTVTLMTVESKSAIRQALRTFANVLDLKGDKLTNNEISTIDSMGISRRITELRAKKTYTVRPSSVRSLAL